MIKKENVKNNHDGTFTVEKTGLKGMDELRAFVGANTNYYMVSDWDTIHEAKLLLEGK